MDSRCLIYLTLTTIAGTSTSCGSHCLSPLQSDSIVVDARNNEGACMPISVDVFLGSNPAPRDIESARDFRVRSPQFQVLAPGALPNAGEVALACVGRDPAPLRECISFTVNPRGVGVLIEQIESSGDFLLSTRNTESVSQPISFAEDTLRDACADAIRSTDCGDRSALLERCIDESVGGCLDIDSEEGRRYFSCFAGSARSCREGETATSCEQWCGFPGTGGG